MHVGKIENCALAEFEDSISAIVFVCGCDMDCVYCQNDVLLDVSNCKQVKWQDVCEKIKWDAIDWLGFTGGEPLYHSDFYGIIRLAQEAKKRNKKVNMDSNGYFMDRNKVIRLKEIEPYLDCLSIDLKHLTRSWISLLFRELDFISFPNDKLRFRKVILDGATDLLDDAFGIWKPLIEFGIDDVKMIPNSNEGRGKNFAPTSKTTLDSYVRYFKKYGINFHE